MTLVWLANAARMNRPLQSMPIPTSPQTPLERGQALLHSGLRSMPIPTSPRNLLD